MIHTLVIVEHDGKRIKRSSLCAASLARQLQGSYAFLVLGSGLTQMAESLCDLGAAAVIVADHPALVEPLADRHAAVAAQVVRSCHATTVVGATSTYTKDVLPRLAALLDAPMLTDVSALERRDGVMHFVRPVSAGSQHATATLDGAIHVLTARAASFEAPASQGERCLVESFAIDDASLPTGMRFISRESPTSDRPELTEARVVVSGGRPLKDKATFDRLIGGLADALGGAVGATRAAVDAGLAPNDCQVGQTGKVVAPELYIAVGVSGAIQHSAGVMDAKVIVAINRDAEAPIFQLATYGLVGDLYEAVPRFISAVRS